MEADVSTGRTELAQILDCLYEVKFHGYRCLAGRDSKGVTGRLAVLQDRFLRYRDRLRKR